MLQNHNVKAYEAAILGNLMPDSADEAFAVLPSLKVMFASVPTPVQLYVPPVSVLCQASPVLGTPDANKESFSEDQMNLVLAELGQYREFQ
ncbi:hypothetical protein QJQ45_011769 [Haematococcus lacustris]|nr:hypothetical protein QJQ45_011769 [Haematococcus lacustris]